MPLPCHKTACRRVPDDDTTVQTSGSKMFSRFVKCQRHDAIAMTAQHARLVRVLFPDPYYAVIACRGERLAVWMKRDSGDGVAVARIAGDGFAFGDVPKPEFAGIRFMHITASGKQALAVRAERNAQNGFSVLSQ